MPDEQLHNQVSRNGTRHGDVSYVTLALPDAAAGRRFYGRVLGWSFGTGAVETEGNQAAEVVPQVGLWPGSAWREGIRAGRDPLVAGRRPGDRGRASPSGRRNRHRPRTASLRTAERVHRRERSALLAPRAPATDGGGRAQRRARGRRQLRGAACGRPRPRSTTLPRRARLVVLAGHHRRARRRALADDRDERGITRGHPLLPRRRHRPFRRAGAGGRRPGGPGQHRGPTDSSRSPRTTRGSSSTSTSSDHQLCTVESGRSGGE